MTEIQSFFKMSESAKLKSGGSRYSDVDNSISYVVFKDYGAKKQTHRGQITIGAFAMKDAGFIRGDKVDICYSPSDGLGRIKRINENGFILGKVTKNKERGRFSFKWAPGMPYVKQTIRMEYEVHDNEIWFNFPEFSMTNEPGKEE